jgi:hypothetical protein
MKGIRDGAARRRARIAAEDFVAAARGASSAIEAKYPGYQQVWTVDALMLIFLRLLSQGYEGDMENCDAPFSSGRSV